MQLAFFLSFFVSKNNTMWQRIQTLYLSLAILINAVIFFIDLAFIVNGDNIMTFTIFGIESVDTPEKVYSTMILAILATFSMLLSLMVIALFKKRQVQIRLGRLNLLLQLAFLSSIFFVSDMAMNELNFLAPDFTLDFQYGTYLSLLPLILIFIALKAIKKDEALVRSADRIR